MFGNSIKPMTLLRRAALACALAIAAPVAAFAQDAPAIIGFVNLQEVGQKARASVDAGQKIDAYRNAVEERIRQRQDALREEEQALGRRRSILAPDAFREEERKFREKVDLAQREFQQVGRQLQEAALEAQQTITARMNEVIQEVATERGINIIFNQTQVTFVQPINRFDITADVIQRMDETLPEITVNLPQE